MTLRVPSISARYDGHDFRSRLEARYAIFFRWVNIPYEYEPRVVHLRPGLNYLPDFWLPDQRMWLEVKGPSPNQAEMEKGRLLHKVTGQAVVIFAGNPGLANASMTYAERGESSTIPQWFRCRRCFRVDLNIARRTALCRCEARWRDFDDAKLIGGYEVARAWKFSRKKGK